MRAPERADDLGVVTDRRGIDHAEAQATRGAAREPLGPIGQVARETEDVASMGDRRLRALADAPAPSVALEQRDPESPLELGEPLGQGRRADADGLRGKRPRRCVGDRHEVLELTDRQVGERRHSGQDTSDLLNNDCSS